MQRCGASNHQIQMPALGLSLGGGPRSRGTGTHLYLNAVGPAVAAVSMQVAPVPTGLLVAKDQGGLAQGVHTHIIIRSSRGMAC